VSLHTAAPPVQRNVLAVGIWGEEESVICGESGFRLSPDDRWYDRSNGTAGVKDGQGTTYTRGGASASGRQKHPIASQVLEGVSVQPLGSRVRHRASHGAGAAC